MSFHSILFLDIETVPQHPDYKQLPAEWKDLWDKCKTRGIDFDKCTTEETNKCAYPANHKDFAMFVHGDSLLRYVHETEYPEQYEDLK